MNVRIGLVVLTGTLFAGAARPAGAEPVNSSSGGSSSRISGAVFTITNEPEQNHVLSFARHDDGTLDDAVSYDTEGAGSGNSLGSQGALALSEDRRLLVVVNPGSNEITSFAVSGALELRDRVASGGTRPISVSVRRGLVYVLNAGGTGNISGFRISPSGELHPIPGSTQSLSSDSAGPAQIEIHPFLPTIVVTEKATSTIDTFDVDFLGRARKVERHPSAGTTPFGFEFTPLGELIVSEAGTNSMSAYAFSPLNLDPVLVNGPVPDTQAAPCWVTVSGDGRYAYTANAGSGSISSYSIGRAGAIHLVDARAADTGGGSNPIDVTTDRLGRHLYVVERGNARVGAFEIQRDGSLEPIDVVGELTPFATGIVGY